MIQLALARGLFRGIHPLSPTFSRKRIYALTHLLSAGGNLVISMSALDYVEDFNKVCFEVNRVLKCGGRFVFCATHPIMLCVDPSEFPEENAPPNYDYRGPITWKWHKEDDFVFTTYRRPLSDYVNALGRNDLYIKRMEELFPITDNFYSEKDRAVRTRFPTVLVVDAVKQN